MKAVSDIQQNESLLLILESGGVGLAPTPTIIHFLELPV